MCYKVRRGLGRPGIVADFGEPNGQTIVIRADMDVLPILESDDREYVSLSPGIMHACGQGSHTAMALGAASILAKEIFSREGTLLISAFRGDGRLARC